MKKLNIAFIWHFHQPNYQENFDGDFLLPWTRLHAAKDYLDMLKWCDKFPDLKLNFDFSPVLLSALEKYANGKKDLHLKLLLKKDDELTDNDKIFILNNYFDLNSENMVEKRPYFKELFEKRINAKEINTGIFSENEYFDIMSNFTLLWFDDYFLKIYPELLGLLKKERNFTYLERRKIYEIQLDIIKKILEEYKTYQDNSKIEISISPYYHPLLPLLLNSKDKEIKDFKNLPDNFNLSQDAKTQVEWAIKKYNDIFKKSPKGMWLAEQAVCPKTLELLCDYNINWTVLDEGILSKSIKKEFVRDFEGNLENPFELNLNYNYKPENKNPINLIFANSFFSNMINFACGNFEQKAAAFDLYEKIKTIQFKLQNSPKKSHLLTIALDGENCWETYPNDGNIFLENLYSLITNDKSLSTVLVGDYVKNNAPLLLDTVGTGSWVNRNFDMWIGEPSKNLAWKYLHAINKIYEDFENKTPKNKDNEEKLTLAKREILIAEGSDWFWWFGEPNETKNDNIFDYLFRNHLMNACKILGVKIPDFLYKPISSQNSN